MPRISCDAARHSSFSSRNKQLLAIIHGLSYVRECVCRMSLFYLRRPRPVPGRTCHHSVSCRLFLSGCARRSIVWWDCTSVWHNFVQISQNRIKHHRNWSTNLCLHLLSVSFEAVTKYLCLWWLLSLCVSVVTWHNFSLAFVLETRVLLILLLWKWKNVSLLPTCSHVTLPSGNGRFIFPHLLFYRLHDHLVRFWILLFELMSRRKILY